MKSEFEYLLEQGMVSRSDNILFQRIMVRCLELGIFQNSKDIAHEFDISMPTVERWLAGTNAPHPVMRGVVYKVIMELQENHA